MRFMYHRAWPIRIAAWAITGLVSAAVGYVLVDVVLPQAWVDAANMWIGW